MARWGVFGWCTVPALACWAACVPSSIGPEPPADVELVGPLCARADACGELVVPGLQKLGGPLSALAMDARDPWLLVGYASPDLAAFSLPPPGELAATPLVPTGADTCWRLPTPRWAAPVRSTTAALTPPPVTAAWARSCPANPTRWVDIRCPGDRVNCGLEAVLRPDCTLAFDALECPDFAPRFAAQADGSSCLLPEDRPARCALGRNAQGGVRWSCNDCIVDQYPVTPPPPFVVRSATVGAPFTGSSQLFSFVAVRYRDLSAGVVRALGVRDDRVLVALSEGGPQADGRCFLTTERRFRVELRDADDLAVRSATVTAACPSRFVPDPHGDGFVVAYYVGSVLWLGRVDRQGRWSDGHPTVRGPAMGPQRALLLSRAMITMTDTALVVAEETEVDTDASNPSWIYTFDPVTLAPRGEGTWVNDEISGVVALSGDRVAVGLRRADVVEALPIDALVPRGGGRRLSGTSRLGSLAVDDEGRVFVLEMSHLRALFHVELDAAVGARIAGVARAFEAPMLITEVLPLGRRLLATALEDRGDSRRYEARLLVLEAEGADVRVLPGAFPVSLGGVPMQGPILQLQRDGRGRVWGVAAWAGAVVRVDVPAGIE